jgi:anti-sigma regulatory factor (Ser/Thr protein kinase)
LRSAEIVDGKLRLILNNTIAAVEDGQCELFRFLSNRALSPLVRHRLEVLFEELVANTIRHGFAKGSGQSIHVLVEQKLGTIELTFEDDGTPFNPLEEPSPEMFSTLETARIGGLGVSLVVKLSADMRYERLEPAPRHADPATFMPRNRTVVCVTE